MRINYVLQDQRFDTHLTRLVYLCPLRLLEQDQLLLVNIIILLSKSAQKMQQMFRFNL